MDIMEIVTRMFSLSSLDKPFNYYCEVGLHTITGHIQDVPVELTAENDGTWVLYVFKTTIDAMTHSDVVTYYELGDFIDDIYVDDNFVAHFISGDNEVTINCLED